MRATPPITTEGSTDPALWDYRGLPAQKRAFLHVREHFRGSVVEGFGFQFLARALLEPLGALVCQRISLEA